MGWFNSYRYRFCVDWPCIPDYSRQVVEPEWQVRLGLAVASVIITALLAALTVLVRG